MMVRGVVRRCPRSAVTYACQGSGIDSNGEGREDPRGREAFETISSTSAM